MKTSALRSRAVQTLTNCARAQVDLIDDLVDTARSTYGKMKVEGTPVDLLQLVEEVIERTSFPAGGRQAPVLLTTDAGAAASYWVWGDMRRLSQVVGNLLSNAMKFSGDGAQVEVSLLKDHDSVVLSVRDEARPISSAGRNDLHRIGECASVRPSRGAALTARRTRSPDTRGESGLSYSSLSRYGHGAT